MYAPIIIEDLKRVISQLGLPETDIVLSISEKVDFGDYSTNVALQLAKQKLAKSYQSAFEIANRIVDGLGPIDYLERVEVAGPGFINFYLSPKSLARLLQIERVKRQTEEHILIEYAQPNTHKELHIGHLRNITIGESLSRLLEDQGAKIFRANYGSDIGLPVAKALYAILKNDSGLNQARGGSIHQKAEFLAKSYVDGNNDYESDPAAKAKIDNLNKQLYLKSPEIVPLWEETRNWSLAYFDSVYSRLDTEFDRVILESEVEEIGKNLVLENKDKIFSKDQGAIIFKGQDFGLHTRVFLTSQGNPTYEAKELGLTLKEQELFPYDLSLHVIDSQQADYFKVVNKVLELLKVIKTDAKRHISYGFVSLSSGRMSSRKGNVVKAEELIDEVKSAIARQYSTDPQITEMVAIGAVKFYFLKYALNSDIAFDIEESISLQGDTGPYLQYTYARIQSLLSKVPDTKLALQNTTAGFEPEERFLLRHLEHFEMMIEKAARSYQPSELAKYLLDLAHDYNLFYQKYPIIKSEKQHFRANLSKKVGETIKEGLYLLGIKSPERM